MPCGSAPNAIEATTSYSRKKPDKPYKAKSKIDELKEKEKAFKLMGL